MFSAVRGLLTVAICVWALPVFATTGGLDTPSSMKELPLAIGGVPAIDIHSHDMGGTPLVNNTTNGNPAPDIETIGNIYMDGQIKTPIVIKSDSGNDAFLTVDTSNEQNASYINFGHNGGVGGYIGLAGSGYGGFGGTNSLADSTSQRIIFTD